MDDGKSEKATPVWKFVVLASLSAGVQFGWALQISLLTPYMQHLGISHGLTSFVWLFGPISGLVVQPIVGYTSDHSKSRLGKRKPFIAVGSLLISIAVLLIGFALDIGYRMGDRLDQQTKPRAITVFIIGFWILDISNNIVQDPTRAFLAELSRDDHRRMRVANSLFSFFMAVGNILGYAAGSYGRLYTLLPFTYSHVSPAYCANIKACFIINVVIILGLSALALATVAEPDPGPPLGRPEEPFLDQVKSAVKTLGRPMWLLFLVTALNWVSWFPFLIADTDWVGREIYGGDVVGTPDERRLYDAGVRHGALGLLFAAITLALMALLIDPLSKALGGARKLWGVVNFILAAALALTVVVTKMAEHERQPGQLPRKDIKSVVLALFAVTGIPQAVTYSIPFALASMFTSDSGSGQGLSLGLLNMAIVIPQMLVSIITGLLDNLFGGGNLPGFILGAVAAVVTGVLAITVLPPPSSNT